VRMSMSDMHRSLSNKRDLMDATWWPSGEASEMIA